MNLIRNATGSNVRRAAPLFAGLLACATALGCGGEDEARPPGDGIELLDRDLGVGSQGPDVEALHEYLTRTGYFPNPALAKLYPAWRPRVASAPAAAGTYDERTADAVRALQRTGGLPATGVVDEATRRLLKAPRCGVPDGDAPSGSEKYAFFGKWSKTALTYQVMNTDDMTLAQAKQEIAAAFASWAAQTNLTFSHVTGGQIPDIKINFTTIAGGFPGQERGVPGVDMPVFIDINVDYTWSFLVRTPSGQRDLQTLMLHEIGHALGLLHSGLTSPTARMYPSITGNENARSLALDDKVAISILYDAWQKMPGGARDIAVGADGSIWKVGSNLIGSFGFGIHKWNGSGWTSAGGVGVRIAVTPGGIPWIIRGDGAVFRRTSSSATSGTWEQVPNAMARDIGIGADGSVWIVGINSVDGGSNFQLWKLNPATTFWTATNGAGVRVTVDSGGRPWLVNSFGGAWRHTTNDPTTGSWENLGGEFDDIAISDGNYAWAVRHLPEGVVGLWSWNEQPQNGSAPARFEWKSNIMLLEGSTSGTGSSVGAGPGGKPYVVHFNGNGATFRTTK